MLEGVAYELVERGLRASSAVKLTSTLLVALFALYSTLSTASWLVLWQSLESSLLSTLVQGLATLASCALATWSSLYLLLPPLAKLLSRPPEGDELFLLEALDEVRRRARHKGRVEVRLFGVGPPNALLIGNALEKVVLVHEGLLGALDKEEVKAVLAHELGHASGLNRLFSGLYLATLCMAMANALSIATLLAGPLELRGPVAPLLLLSMLIALASAEVMALSIGRLREYLADMHSAKTVGAAALVRALEKLERSRSSTSRRPSCRSSSLMIAVLGLVLRLARVHPSAEDRIRLIKRCCEELS